MAGTGSGGFGIDILGLDAAAFYETYSENERQTNRNTLAKRDLKERTAQRLSDEKKVAAQLSAQERALQQQLSAGANATAAQTKLIQQYAPAGILAAVVVGAFWFLKR